jgi:hypothetical protein
LDTRIYPYISKLRAEGIAAGEAKAVVRVLKSRGICMTSEERDRILGCSDIAVLDRWLDRASTVTTIRELFDDGKAE